MSRGGRVFTGVRKTLIVDEQKQLVTLPMRLNGLK